MVVSTSLQVSEEWLGCGSLEPPPPSRLAAWNTEPETTVGCAPAPEVDLRRGWFLLRSALRIAAVSWIKKSYVVYYISLLRDLSAVRNTASDGPLVEKNPSHRETKRASNGM